MFIDFLKNRFFALKYAFKGACLLLKNEASIKVQSFIGLMMIVLGFYFKLTPTEWMFQMLATGLVLSIEGLNTAVEEMANFVHPDHHKKIGYIKDIAAGAVFFAAVTAVCIGLFIYIPKIM